jgi:hypothetical protein
MPAIAGGASVTEGQHTAEAIVWEQHPQYRETVTVISGQNLKAGAVVGRAKYGVGRVSIPTVVGTGNGTASLVSAGAQVEIGNYVLTCKEAVTHGGVFSLVSPSGLALPDFTMTPGAGAATAYVSDHINFTITDGSTDFIVGDSFTFVVSTTAPTVIGGTGNGTISVLSLGPDAKPGNYRVINREAITNGGRFEVIDPDGESLGDNFLLSAGAGNATAIVTDQIRFTITDGSGDFIVGNYFDVAVFNQLGGGKVRAWDPTNSSDGRHVIAGVLYAAVDASTGDKKGVLVARHAVVLKSALQWGAAITAAQKQDAYEDMLERLNIKAADAVTV